MAETIDVNENRTPTWGRIIRRFIDRELRSLYTMIPGRVEEYDPATQRATIQPLIRVPIPDAALNPDATDADVSEDLPQLTGVPIIFPRSKAASIYWPIYPGSFVMLICSMQSMEKFLAGDGSGTYEPQNTEIHSLSDAVAIPGLFPRQQVIENLDDDDLRLTLESQHGKRVQIYLGGDTGDFVVIPDDGSFVQLGEADMGVDKGVARLNDATIANKSETDSAFFTWLAGFVNIIQTWTVAPNDGGLALQAAMNAFITGNAVPTELKGKINAASETVLAKD